MHSLEQREHEGVQTRLLREQSLLRYFAEKYCRARAAAREAQCWSRFHFHDCAIGLDEDAGAKFGGSINRLFPQDFSRGVIAAASCASLHVSHLIRGR